MNKIRKQYLVNQFYHDIEKEYPEGLFNFIESKHPSIEQKMNRCEEKITILINHPKANLNQLNKELSSIYGLLDRGQRMYTLTKGTKY